MRVEFRTGAGRWGARSRSGAGFRNQGETGEVVTGHWPLVLPRSDITVGYGLFDVGVLLFPFSALGPRGKREVEWWWIQVGLNFACTVLEMGTWQVEGKNRSDDGGDISLRISRSCCDSLRLADTVVACDYCLLFLVL